MVAGAPDQVVQAVAFAAHHQHAVAGEVKVVIVRGAAFIETNDPEIVALEFFQSADKIDNAGDSEMLLSAGGSLGGNGAQRSGSTLRHDDGIRTGPVGRAKQGSQILWILDAIERKHEPRRASGRDDILNGEKLLSANDGHDTLMSGRARNIIEGFAWFGADTNLEGAAEIDDGLQPFVAALTRHKDVFEAAASGFQSLFNGMDTVENLHRFQCKGLLIRREGIA